MKKTVSGILIFSILLFLFTPFPAVSALDGDGAEEIRPVLASSAGVYADPFLSGEPLRVLQKGDEVEIIAGAGRTVVEVRLTLDNGEQFAGFMSRSAFEAMEGWPGEAVRQYVAEACVRIGLMSAEIRYEQDDFSLARYRAEIKTLYRLRAWRTEKTPPFPSFCSGACGKSGLFQRTAFPARRI